MYLHANIQVDLLTASNTVLFVHQRLYLCMKYDVFHSIRIIGSATIGSLRIQQGIIDFIQWTPLGLGGHLWA